MVVVWDGVVVVVKDVSWGQFREHFDTTFVVKLYSELTYVDE